MSRAIILIFVCVIGAISLVKAQENKTETPEVVVALLGDTGVGNGFAAVLSMIANEKADVLMINGDLGYTASPSAWQKMVTTSININDFSVIGSLGNHDTDFGNAGKYVEAFYSFRNGVNQLKVKCTGGSQISQGRDIAGVDEVCTFGNVTLIPNSIGQVLNETYLEQRLESKLKTAPAENWKLVGYHYTLASMNPGIKKDENTFKFFNLIRENGAIGAQAHTHSAMASCPINSVFAKNANILCHPDFTDLETRFVLPGTGIYIDSSLGGKDVRGRTRCKSPNEKGCEHLIDLITTEGYTRTDGMKKADFNRDGALFIVFNAGGDPDKAFAYFKSVDGQVIFKFSINR